MPKSEHTTRAPRKSLAVSIALVMLVALAADAAVLMARAGKGDRGAEATTTNLIEGEQLLQISSTPSGAHVTIDGTSKEGVTPWTVSVKRGKAQAVRLWATGYQTKVFLVFPISTRTTDRYHVDLAPEPAARASTRVARGRVYGPRTSPSSSGSMLPGIVLGLLGLGLGIPAARVVTVQGPG